MFPMDQNELPSVGWAGFLDWQYMLQSFGALVLATTLGAVIAFHPTTQRSVDTREEAELPKVLIMYALVGAVIGEIVLKYGMVVGFVIFGLGGLMRRLSCARRRAPAGTGARPPCRRRRPRS